MSDWNMDKCKVHYSDLIPQSIIKDYDLDSVLCTTFSLQQEQLHELLYEIGAFPLIAKEKVHIFYDGFSRDGKKSFESVISEKLLHEIVLENEGKLFAFHPKVVLMRYKKKESVETIRYVVIVSSKNISTANLWDAYALAYGDVGTDEHESGRKLAEFIGEIYKKVDKKDISKDFIIPDELRKTKFVPGDESDAREVIFYKPEEVWDEIKDKSGLTIISPFLSDEFILESKDNIKNLISTEQGYAKLKEETIKFMLDGNRAFLFNGDLHAKIYSWNENDEIRYIVGSSNATKNGCNITNDSQNIEYNTGFGSKDEIFKSIEERIKPINIEDYKVWKKDASDDVDFRRVYVEFWKNKRIECSKKDNEYIVSVDFAEFEQLKKNVLLDGFKVLCTVGEKEKDIEKNIEFRLPSPPLYFRVTIKNTKAKDDDEIDRKEKVYIFSLYDEWEDDEIKKQFDNNCRENRLKLLEKIQSQIIEGKQYKRFSLEQRNSDSKIRQEKSKYNINKVYIHEELIRLKQNMADEDSFIQALDELKSISEMLLEEKQVDDKQTKLKETIDKLLRYKRGRR